MLHTSFSRLFWVSSVLLWSSALSLPIAAGSISPQESITSADLQARYPNTEILSLKASDDSILALHKKSMAPFTRGTFILLPDGSRHAAIGNIIDPLREEMVDQGWDTLSVMMPPYDGMSGEDADKTYLAQLKSRIDAAIAQAKQQPGAIVILAQGHSGALINQLLQQNQIETPQALILIGATLRDPSADLAAIQAMSQHKVPTLDILQYSDGDSALNSLRARVQWTRKQVKDLYRQRYWPEDSYRNDPWLQKEVIGWLRFIGF